MVVLPTSTTGHDGMSGQRHRWAMEATQMNDLTELARLLTGAVHETLNEGGLPHLDPACRLLCYQIALAGNGDLPFHSLYLKMYDYCEQKVAGGPNYESITAMLPEEYKGN